MKSKIKRTSSLTLDDAINIRTDYLSSLSVSAISEKYQLSEPTIRKVLNSEDATAKRLAQENIQIKFDHQTDKISEIKDQILNFLTLAIQTAQKSQQPQLFIKDMAPILDKLDHIQRLNLNRATEITQSNQTITRIDLAETLKALDTPDKQKAFLRKQLTDSIVSSNNKLGERV